MSREIFGNLTISANLKWLFNWGWITFKLANYVEISLFPPGEPFSPHRAPAGLVQKTATFLHWSKIKKIDYGITEHFCWKTIWPLVPQPTNCFSGCSTGVESLTWKVRNIGKYFWKGGNYFEICRNEEICDWIYGNRSKSHIGSYDIIDFKDFNTL